MSDTVQRVKDKLNIVDVVAPYVKLTKAGRYFKGLSPFNKEKTPSFFVNPERGTYYCFSSSQGGDAFTFVEKMEGVDFKGALKILAEKAGVDIQYTGNGKQHTEKIERMREAMARAEQFYTRNLDEKGSAYQYALSRGLSKETISAWGLGYAPDAWRALLEELSAAGFTTAELVAAGLIKEADEKKGTYYDRFRDRLMFPIRDGAGRTVAFTGRALKSEDPAKYLNSPETELFRKSHILFGMDRAKDAIRTRSFALLVEGQFDLILLHQIGFQNTIALSGTALSPEHLALIKRYSDNLMLALDADKAGLAASEKNAHAALVSGMKVKAIVMPEGQDPADLAKESPKEFVKRVQGAQSIVEFFLSVLSSLETDQHRLVLAVERIVVPLVRAMKSPMEREHFANTIARHVGSSAEAVRASLSKAPVTDREDVGGEAQKDTPMTSRAVLIGATAAVYKDTPLAKRLSEEYARITGTPLEDETLPERALFEAGLLFGESPEEHAGDELLQAFERFVLTTQVHEATTALRRAESVKDESAIQEALAVCKQLSARLAELS
ncbi:DNA primase [Candidatus Parcubacteria bacterium]|nr:DNA primase [Candidatus Parcubacteria bacterium]